MAGRKKSCFPPRIFSWATVKPAGPVASGRSPRLTNLLVNDVVVRLRLQDAISKFVSSVYLEIFMESLNAPREAKQPPRPSAPFGRLHTRGFGAGLKPEHISKSWTRHCFPSKSVLWQGNPIKTSGYMYTLWGGLRRLMHCAYPPA